MRSPEGHEKTAIKRFLDGINAWHFCPYMAGYGKSGVADIIACIDGIFWSIEVKREGKEPTPRQQTRMGEIEKAGGFACAGTAEKVIAYIKAALAK